MKENEIFNILYPEAAPYLSAPAIEGGPLQSAKLPKFSKEPKPYSINTNAIGLLGHVLQEAIMEGEVRSFKKTLENFSGRADFQGPGSSRINVGYNVPSPLGNQNDWEVGVRFPFNL